MWFRPCANLVFTLTLKYPYLDPLTEPLGLSYAVDTGGLHGFRRALDHLIIGFEPPLPEAGIDHAMMQRTLLCQGVSFFWYRPQVLNTKSPKPPSTPNPQPETLASVPSSNIQGREPKMEVRTIIGLRLQTLYSTLLFHDIYKDHFGKLNSEPSSLALNLLTPNHPQNLNQPVAGPMPYTQKKHALARAPLSPKPANTQSTEPSSSKALKPQSPRPPQPLNAISHEPLCINSLL